MNKHTTSNMINLLQSQTNAVLDFKNSLYEYSDDDFINSLFTGSSIPDELFTNVNKYIATLPIYEQNLIYLYAIYGSYAKVAKHLNLSVGIVYKYTHNIIKKIHEHIS